MMDTQKIISLSLKMEKMEVKNIGGEIFFEVEKDLRAAAPDDNILQFFSKAFEHCKKLFIEITQQTYIVMLNFLTLKDNIIWLNDNFDNNLRKLIGEDSFNRI